MSSQKCRVLPKPRGTFSTGCTDLMFGRSKDGTLMRMFYPSIDTNNEENLSPWYPGYEYTKGAISYMNIHFAQPFVSFFNWLTSDIKFPSAWNGPMAEGVFPVIVFSHGLSANRTLYTTICNDIASHGFVVAAVEHRDESASASFVLTEKGDEEWIPYRQVQKGQDYPTRNDQVKIRASECTRALDALVRLTNGEVAASELATSAPTNVFKGKIDVSRPLIAGHSFGAITSILTLGQDERFKAGLLLDPWMFPLKAELNSLAESVTQPMLFILTETFQNQPNFKAYEPFELERNTIVTLKGSVHQNQADSPFLFNWLGRTMVGAQSCLHRDVAMSLNNKLMINFISKNLGLPNIGLESDSSLAQKVLQLGLKLEPASLEGTHELLNFDPTQTAAASKL